MNHTNINFAAFKISKCIDSCKSQRQLDSTQRMINLYHLQKPTSKKTIALQSLLDEKRLTLEKLEEIFAQTFA